jgi:hypothetical protein
MIRVAFVLFLRFTVINASVLKLFDVLHFYELVGDLKKKRFLLILPLKII